MPARSGHPQELKILQQARGSELDSLRQYLRFALRTRNVAGKDMFARLASDELEHASLFERLIHAIKETGTCSVDEATDLPAASLIPLLADSTRRIKGESGLDDISALETALELENRAAAFYSIASDNAAGSLRLVLRRLAEIEAGHAALIQAELDSIRQDGFWFGMPEFTLESERDRSD